MDAELDLLEPRWRRDPHPLYRRLRDEDPVCWSPRLGMWVVTRYDDVKEVVQDATRYSVDRFGPDAEGRPRQRAQFEDLARLLRKWAVYSDPPAHTRLRALLSQGFTSRRLEAMRPRIQAIVDDLVARMAPDERVDFVAAFAFPLPATVIATMLGVPTADLDQVKIWSDRIAAYIGGAQAGRDNVDEAKQGLRETCDYFRGLVRARRRRPESDLLTSLLAAESEGERLDDEELVANCVLLLFAGHETTTNLLANGLFHLLREPEQLELLRRDPSRIPDAVEELLRYEPPVAGTIRIAARDVELRERKILRGQPVAAMIASANRDPRRFRDPERLDVRRGANRHLSFGHGIHFCLGAGLARLEAQIALRTLLARFRRIALLDPEPHWKPQVFFRGLERLALELGS